MIFLCSKLLFFSLKKKKKSLPWLRKPSQYGPQWPVLLQPWSPLPCSLCCRQYDLLALPQRTKCTCLGSLNVSFPLHSGCFTQISLLFNSFSFLQISLHWRDLLWPRYLRELLFQNSHSVIQTNNFRSTYQHRHIANCLSLLTRT